MPYAAKATVEHEFLTNLLKIYVTFRLPMRRSAIPRATPPVFDWYPPLAKWILKADTVTYSIVSCLWNDEYTLELTSDVIATRPAGVTLKYDGPNEKLETAWHKQWEPFGPIVSVELWTAVLANLYPQRALMFHTQATLITGGSLVVLQNTAFRYCEYSRIDPGDNGDSFSNSFFLKAGTYSFGVLGQASAAKGMIDWYIDGTRIILQQDWYSSLLTQNLVKTVSGITIPTDGYHKLIGTINGKNAASTAYSMFLTAYWLKPTTDPHRT
jgi:hypothetical protein